MIAGWTNPNHICYYSKANSECNINRFSLLTNWPKDMHHPTKIDFFTLFSSYFMFYLSSFQLKSVAEKKIVWHPSISLIIVPFVQFHLYYDLQIVSVTITVFISNRFLSIVYLQLKNLISLHLRILMNFGSININNVPSLSSLSLSTYIYFNRLAFKALSLNLCEFLKKSKPINQQASLLYLKYYFSNIAVYLWMLPKWNLSRLS